MNSHIVLCLAAVIAGAVNSIAGGGTLLTFPALLSAGISPVMANATSTVALVPGSMAGAWGYRREFQVSRRWLLLLIGPCILGGAVGSLLVTRMEEKYFSYLIPWLILAATLLFLIQPYVSRFTGIGSAHAPPSGWTLVGVVFFQFLVAIYGGYFGAGIGILMLSSLGLLGLGSIHRMNALKTLLAACINAVSVCVFVMDDMVNWRYALAMAAAAILGGYLGARFATRLKPYLVRWAVISIGLILSAYFFYKSTLPLA